MNSSFVMENRVSNIYIYRELMGEPFHMGILQSAMRAY